MSRPLSPIEHVMYLVDQVARQNFVMVARMSGSITESALRRALDIIQEKFPTLKWKIKDEGKVPEFDSEGVPQIPLHVMEQKSEDHWLEVSEEEVEQPLPFNKGPLIRATLLTSQNKFDLLVTFCHIPTDGISCIMVMERLLSITAKLQRGESVSPEPPLPVPLPTLELLRKDLKFSSEFFDISSRIYRARYKSVELEGDADVPVEKRRTRIIQEVLSQTETKKLVKTCKQKKTSVHAALCAAFFQAVIEDIRESQDVPGKGPLMIGSYTPVNLRHLFTDKYREEDIGYYIGIAVHNQPIDERSSLWAAARKVKKSIEREIRFGRHIKILRDVAVVLKQFSTSTPLEFTKVLHNANAPLVSTNLGKLPISEQFGDLTLEEFFYPASVHFDSKSGFAIDAGTFRGRMHITFLYASPYISKKKANKIVESTMKRLRDAIK